MPGKNIGHNLIYINYLVHCNHFILHHPLKIALTMLNHVAVLTFSSKAAIANPDAAPEPARPMNNVEPILLAKIDAPT